MAKYEMPVIDVPKEDVKVNVSMVQDADNVSLMLVIPFDILREEDQSKIGMILKHSYNELDKLAKSLTTTFTAENRTIIEKIFGKQ
ncbi:hypothetical protein SAMN02745150_01485 [Brevinema andersonii]|uniref:Uncharacterized protein n=1 Tax=Brevinema andersonii TaxID=34097 RepID=A0A1I1FLY5_BREAD|nr:hypothetical protein [Brevinema andersonii]SFB98113.1 hypothetical protein SAMN02745150_01485 [Brevinema andersonii]